MILLYHHVAPFNIIRSHLQKNDITWNFSITPENFESHILCLKQRKIKFITLHQLISDIKNYGVECSDTVVLTFDDGWLDNYQYAYPILIKHGISACFFVTAKEFDENISNPRTMTINQIRHLLNAGMEVGSHTMTHPPRLSQLDVRTIMEEVSVSKFILENKLQIEVEYFAYPGGDFNAFTVEIVKKAGYKAACSILSPHINNTDSLYWLFRSTLTEKVNSLSDYYRLNKRLIRCFSYRVQNKLLMKLNS